MILTFDCGNSMIKIGIFDGDNLIKSYVINTDRKKSSDEYAILLRDMISKYDFDGAIISSVVPSLTNVIKRAVKRIFDIDSLVVDKTLKTKIPIKIDNPSELGSDLLCGAIGALKFYNAPLIVVDLGTANKVSVVDKNGAFIGCVISCGVSKSLKTLVDSTSLLAEVPLSFPKKTIGKNTKDSIQSGLLNSVIYSIKGFSSDIESELGYELKKIITGGFSNLFAEKLENFVHIDNLVLYGLNEIYKINNYGK